MHNLLLYYLWMKHSFPSAGTIASHLTHILQCTLVVAGDTHAQSHPNVVVSKFGFDRHSGQNSDSFTQN